MRTVEVVYIEPFDRYMIRVDGKNVAEDGGLDARDAASAVAKALGATFKETNAPTVPRDSHGWYEGVDEE